MIGKTLAHYEIVDLLGKGGMGEVYRARDTKLGREVALKILPSDIAQDAERLARFRREAKVLASLNHTNIATIHGLEEDQGQLFLIMELAEGEDLTQRIARGPMSVEETLGVARQLAQGLDQAHERGVVHRDLKPANVKLSEDGAVKILDFGLARAYAGESPEEGELANSPTITAAMTQAGTILGTAAYMSPEQARGLDVDRRADIWAFGVILYEMLTADRVFEGDTVSDTLAGVLKTEPDFDALPDDTPAGLRWLIERCLEKQPSKRLRDIGEARVLLESDLDQAPASTMGEPGVVVTERPGWVVPALIGVAVLALVLGAGLARLLATDAPSPHAIHATLLSPPGTEIQLQNGSHMAISPDGTRVTFVAEDTTGTELLWVRRLDSPAAHVLSGTENASYPFWSWDGRKIAFFAGGKLKKIDAGGGVATAVCDAPNGRGGTWTADERILFAFEIRDHLQMVSASGGAPVALTEMDTLAWSHRWPVILPDQEHFLYLSMSDTDELRWRSIESAASEKTLLTDVHRGAFADGHLFFGRDGALWARPFDPSQGEFLGEEVLVAEAVVTSSNFGSGAYSVAEDGTMVYAAGTQSQRSVMAVYDTDGNELERFEFDNGFAQDANLSPDGRHLALALFPTEGRGEPDIWIRDLQRGTLSRFTTDEGVDDPVWGPEGDRIIYASQDGHLYVRSARGTREILMEVEIGDDGLPHDWSRDGRFVLYSAEGEGRDIWVLPIDDPDARYPLVKNPHFNIHPTFSPDGQWVAYMSVESGDPQIYLRRFAEGGGTWPVSPGWGIQPRWKSDGSEIYFVGRDGLYSIDVDFTERGPDFGAQRKLFDVNVLGGRSNTHRYAVIDDTGRFVVQIDPNDRSLEGTTLELVVGWRQIVGRP